MLKSALNKVMQYVSMDACREKQDIVLDDARAVRSSGDVLNHFELAGNHPNPFTAETTIVYYTPEMARVRLAVFDLLGHRVALLENRQVQAGRHEVLFDATGMPKGQYLCRLSTPYEKFSQMMLLH